MADKMREEFEAWYWDYHHKDCGKDYLGVVFSIGSNGMYQGIACEGAWQGWKASRAALCVELPEVRVLDGGRIAEIGYEMAIDDFELVLDAAGVRHK